VLELLFTLWLFDRPVAIAASATARSIVYPLLRNRRGRLTAGRLSLGALRIWCSRLLSSPRGRGDARAQRTLPGPE